MTEVRPEVVQALRTAETIGQMSLWERIKAEAVRNNEPVPLLQWPHNDLVEDGYPPYLVQEHCVRNEDWQRIRLSMKGLPTHEKLLVLKKWWDGQYLVASSFPTACERSALWTATQIQVGNYLGALRRGGQLDSLNRIKKYL